jgi:MOSC domain-containing protein YiiM
VKIVSLNLGFPRDVVWHGQTVTTGIYKSPVQGPVRARKLDLDGDRQADLTVHGGEYKAVYVYPVEHYAYWKKELPGRDLSPGVFGENFTTEGLLETQVHIGDRFAIGSAEFTVTQPRLPCYKLGIRFETDDMVKKFLASRRTGFYFAVTKEGQITANDEIKPLTSDATGITIAAFLELYLAKNGPPPTPSRSTNSSTSPPYPTTGNPISTTASRTTVAPRTLRIASTGSRFLMLSF